VDEIIEQHIIAGRPVQRLTIPPERLTGRAPPPSLAADPLPEDTNSQQKDRS